MVDGRTFWEWEDQHNNNLTPWSFEVQKAGTDQVSLQGRMTAAARSKTQSSARG
jgi:hypothetical protein